MQKIQDEGEEEAILLTGATRSVLLIRNINRVSAINSPNILAASQLIKRSHNSLNCSDSDFIWKKTMFPMQRLTGPVWLGFNIFVIAASWRREMKFLLQIVPSFCVAQMLTAQSPSSKERDSKRQLFADNLSAGTHSGSLPISTSRLCRRFSY